MVHFLLYVKRQWTCCGGKRCVAVFWGRGWGVYEECMINWQAILFRSLLYLCPLQTHLTKHTIHSPNCIHTDTCTCTSYPCTLPLPLPYPFISPISTTLRNPPNTIPPPTHTHTHTHHTHRSQSWQCLRHLYMTPSSTGVSSML